MFSSILNTVAEMDIAVPPNSVLRMWLEPDHTCSPLMMEKRTHGHSHAASFAYVFDSLCF